MVKLKLIADSGRERILEFNTKEEREEYIERLLDSPESADYNFVEIDD